MSLSIARISASISAIYDCVLEPSKWPSVLDEIRIALNFQNAVLGVSVLPGGTAILGVALGIEPAYLAQIPAHGNDVIELWGGLKRMQQYPLEEPIVQSQVVDPLVMRSNAYYQSWVRGQGLIDAVAIGLERNTRMVAHLSFGRHESAGAITDDEVDSLRVIAPHFRRAIAISQLLELQGIVAASVGSVLDRLTTSVILVDDVMTLIYANPLGEAMLDRKDLVRIRNGRVVAAVPDLETAVSQATTNEMDLGRRGGTGIPTRGLTGEPHVIHVLPLRRRESRPGLFVRATAALFITPADPDTRLPVAAFAALYGLTPAEAQIGELVAHGVTKDNIAYQLGLATSTVKTHLQRVFEKTECHRQPDLLRLFSTMRSPISSE